VNFTAHRTIDGAAPTQQAPPLPPAFQPQIVRSVRMHPLLAAGVGGCVFLALLAYGLTRKPVYKAQSLVYEEPAAAKLLSDGTTGTFDPSRYDSYLDQQKQIIVRADVLGAAIATLPAPVWHELGPNEQAAVASLQAQLKADRVKTSYQLSIGLESSDPKAAAAIVNAVTQAYLEAVHKESSAQTDQRALLLAEERSRIEGEMQTTRQEQAALSASLGVASPVGETANPYDFEIAGVRQQLLQARQAHDVAAAQLNSISGGGTGDAALKAAADETLLGDPALASMRATVSARQATLSGQMAGMKPDNPVYRQDLDELADLDKTLDNMTQQSRGKAERQLQEKLRTELERTADIEARMNAQLARLTATATTAAPKLQRAAELADDLTRLNTRYAAVDDALRSLQLEANGPGVVRLSLAAAVPETPEPNRKMLLLAAAPVAGIIFGIAAAVFARRRDRRVYSPRDVEDVLGFAPMTVLPAKSDVSARVMEEYVLRLAAAIEGAYRGSGAQTFLLTAASAATDIRPLRKALTAKLERIGLDIAVASTTDLLLAAPVTSGEQRMARPGEGAGFVAGHLADLKGAHALVIINAPPLGTSAETEYVARCADATILVAESGVTTREELFDSARLLQRLEARGVGAVLQGLALRFAGETFRQAVEAVEQRQPDLYNSTIRTRPIATAPEAAEIEYIQPRQRPPAGPPQPAFVAPAYGWSPAVAPEPLVPEPHAPPVVTATAGEELPQDEPLAEELAEVPAATSVPETIEPSHEKMSPKLPGPRESVSDGGPPMSGSKNWFQRLLHRDDERVSIIPEGGDDDEPIDEASFITSRISRSAAAYESPALTEPEALMSRRFVLADLHANEPDFEPEKPRLDDVSSAEAAAVQPPHREDDVEPAHLFVVPPPAPPEFVPAPVASPVAATPRWDAAAFQAAAYKAALPGVAEPTIEELSATRLLARLRPARPLSFHELEALTHPVAAEADAGTVAAAAEPAAEPVAEQIAPALSGAAEEEMVHAVELPPELTQAHARSSHLEQARGEPVAEAPPAEFHAAEPGMEEHAPSPVLNQTFYDEPAEEEGEEAVVEQPVDAAAENVTTTEQEDPADAEYSNSITKEIARITSGSHAGAGRWDPIPPLRPTDSGWNRMHGSNGNGNGTVYAGVERRRGDDWSWTSREADRDKDLSSSVEAGAQRWAEPAVSGEFDEPTLSRPWGLLSRFQQTHLITPARRNGASKGASDNGSASGERDREQESGPFQPHRNS
jgi:uncharacterized protein involved in exopolysaccharide biosynthesis